MNEGTISGVIPPRPGQPLPGWLAAILAGLLTAASFPALAAAPAAPAAPREETIVSDATLTALIRQLGDEDFSRREKAEAELRRLGLAAFDALHKAQTSDDIEISLRARYLLHSMTVRWYRDDDAPEVKEILRGYEDKSTEERQQAFQQLGKLRDFSGVPALSRLARFEVSPLLSKHAALAVLQQPAVADPTARTRLADRISQEIGASPRDGAQWLRTYVAMLSNAAATAPTWERIRQQEEELLTRAPGKTEAEIVRDLVRWEIELLERLQQPEQVTARLNKALELVDGSREQVSELLDWLVRRKSWVFIAKAAAKFSDRFQESPLLTYTLFEAEVQLGFLDQAQKTAQRAFDTAIENKLEHLRAAELLQKYGRFDWSEREFRRVIKSGPPGSEYEVIARYSLAEMLHDNLQDKAGAEVLQALVDLMGRDQTVVATVSQLRFGPESIRSRMHYLYSEDHRQAGRIEQQIEELRKGAKADPNDADVLIAMYRVQPPDDKWVQQTKNLIRAATDKFRADIRRYQSPTNNNEDEDDAIPVAPNRQLATALNQLAWLVANTEGDFEEAVRCSQRSVHLMPEAGGYLDTLGRCYYAKRDYENAIKSQQRALELDPHSGQMKRQLKLFQDAWDAARKGPAKTAG